MIMIGYARVSSNDQNPDLQIDALRDVGCRRIFDEKISSAARDRSQLAAALDFLQLGDTLVVWKMDRLARSLSQLLTIIEGLHRRQCAFRSLTESIDTTTAGGRLIFHVFGALAEFERNIIRERTLAGLEAAKRRGRHGGRPKSLNDASLVAAKAMLADGNLTIAEIARQLGVSEPTLYKYIPHPRSTFGPTP
jgi:DNA invertase Pin-like site-specific DNA recombinase